MGYENEGCEASGLLIPSLKFDLFTRNRQIWIVNLLVRYNFQVRQMTILATFSTKRAILFVQIDDWFALF